MFTYRNFEIFARDGTREKICPVDPLIKPASSAASPRSSSSSNVSNLCRPLNAENRDKEKVRHPSENAHPDEDFPESLVQTRNEHMVEREQSLVERNTKSSNLAWESHSQRMKKKIIKDDEDKGASTSLPLHYDYIIKYVFCLSLLTVQLSPASSCTYVRRTRRLLCNHM